MFDKLDQGMAFQLSAGRSRSKESSVTPAMTPCRGAVIRHVGHYEQPIPQPLIDFVMRVSDKNAGNKV